MKKVLVISELYYPEQNATGYFLTGIAEGLAKNGFNVSVLSGQPTYNKHFSSWEKRINLLIKYEKLKTDSLNSFKQILDLYDIELSDKEIKKYILESNFENMNKAQSLSDNLKNEFPDDYKFVRTTRRNQWQDFFSSDDLAYYNNLKLKYNFNLYD